MLTKKDVPRLRRFLNILARSTFGNMPGKDMIQVVNDMEWLATLTAKLDNKMEILSSTPIESKSNPKSKKAKK